MMKTYTTLTILLLVHFFTKAQSVKTILEPNSPINDALIVDRYGNIFGSDFGTSTSGGSSVYKIDTAGVLTTFSKGYSSCNGLAFDKEDNLYVVDYTSLPTTHQIYKINSDGVRRPYGPQINGASGIIFDPLSDTLYVSQYNATSGSRISKLSKDGHVSLHCSHLLLNGPVGMAFDDAHQLYVANFNDGEIYKLSENGNVITLIANIPNVSFWGVGFLTYASGFLYATGIGVHKIFKIGLDGEVSILAGTGEPGTRDGSVKMAQFNRPNGIATNARQDKLYISDYGTKAIREITNLTTSIEDQKKIDSNIDLLQIHPNPAINYTNILYHLSRRSKIKIQLFSIDGNLITTLISTEQIAGEHSFQVRTENYSSGVYYCKLSSKNYAKSIKFTITH